MIPPGSPHHKIAQPPNLSTLDHLDHKLSPMRGKFNNRGYCPRTVLACRECNQRRGIEDYIKFSGHQ
jgi:hypothetical protein